MTPQTQPVALNFSKPRVEAEVPASITLSASAESAIALAPLCIQKELFQLMSSVQPDAVRASPDLFVAKSKSGYRVLFRLKGDKKELVEVFTPSQLERFANHVANG